jgi:hypothetical protein
MPVAQFVERAFASPTRMPPKKISPSFHLIEEKSACFQIPLGLLEFLETLIETTSERCKIKFLVNRSTEALSSVHKLAARAYKSQLGHEIGGLNATGCVLVGGSVQSEGNVVLARLASHKNKINTRFLGTCPANLFEFECLVKILHLFMLELSLLAAASRTAPYEFLKFSRNPPRKVGNFSAKSRYDLVSASNHLSLSRLISARNLLCTSELKYSRTLILDYSGPEVKTSVNPVGDMRTDAVKRLAVARSFEQLRSNFWSYFRTRSQAIPEHYRDQREHKDDGRDGVDLWSDASAEASPDF